MIKRLRRQFVCVIMVIVMLMLGTILGVVIHFTGRNLKDQSLQMMQLFLQDHRRQDAGSRTPENGPRLSDRGPKLQPPDSAYTLRLPCFALCVSPQGEVLDISGQYYDPSNQEEYIQSLADIAMESEDTTGILWKYELRYPTP